MAHHKNRKQRNARYGARSQLAGAYGTPTERPEGEGIGSHRRRTSAGEQIEEALELEDQPMSEDYAPPPPRSYEDALRSMIACAAEPDAAPRLVAADRIMVAILKCPHMLVGALCLGSKPPTPLDRIPRAERDMLRPVAETLAMLTGNAFFGLPMKDGNDFWEQYVPEAKALFEANGGAMGWAGRASFAAAQA